MAAPAAASSSTTSTSTSLPTSQSAGSLENLARRPLVDRQSNPIISTEGDGDSDNESLEPEEHLRASERDDFLYAADASSSAEQKYVLTAKSNAMADADGGGSFPDVATVDSKADNDGLDRSSASSYRPKTKKTSHLYSNSNVSSISDPSNRRPRYIPDRLTGAIMSTQSPSPGGSRPCSRGNCDVDASGHARRKGSGYLAPEVALSTPTDVFAAGCTLLQLCAIGNLHSVGEYVANSFNNVNFRDYDRRTALHVASSEGHLEVVKFLVKHGAIVNRSDRWGGSPLDDAHRHRHTSVARYLRSRGARTGSLNLTSNLIAAAAAGDMEEVAMICGSNDRISALSADPANHHLTLDLSDGKSSKATTKGGVALDMSMSRGSVTRVSPATRQGSSLDTSEPNAMTSSDAVDINRGDYDKRTALHLAAGEGHVDVVEFLCKRGANVNVEDRWGGKPLDDALQRGNERVAEVLRKYGAKSADDADFHRKSFRQPSLHDSINDQGSHDDSNGRSARELLALEADEQFRVDFSELEMIERIGSGAFGEIYKCRWRGILVAAKCIKASKIQREWLLKNRSGLKNKDRIANRVEAIRQTTITDEEKRLALEDFRKETAILRRLRHPNIVMMLAYSHTEDVEVMISEIMRCSLLDIFKANSISNSRIPKRTQIAYAQQLAQGMNHLHKSRPPIIHRDLKPANLLIDFSGHLKIADFGLAKIRPDPEQCETEVFRMTGETGSYRFMAPEVFRHEEYTQSVDVYSYAMIFYYLLRGTSPWAGLSGLDAVTKAAVDGERPLIPRNVDERLSTLLKRCWDEDPKSRPTFEEIVRCLDVYSHDVFKTNDGEVQMSLKIHDSKCACVIS